MFREVRTTPEEEEEMIRKVAEIIHKYSMEAAAILMIESVKPLAYVGGQMGRLFISPFLPIFGEAVDIGGEKFFTVFEKRENVEKLLNLLEEMAREEDAKKKEEKQLEEAPKEAEKRKGWRWLIPFI